MASNDWVDIYHPDLDQTATVHRRSVAHHAKAGWREAHSLVDPEPVEPIAVPVDLDEDPDFEEGE